MKIGVLSTAFPRNDDDPTGHFVRGFAEWLALHAGTVEVIALDRAEGAAALAEGGLPWQLRGPFGAARAAALSARLFTAARRRIDRWDAVVSHWLLPCGLVGDALAGPRRHLAIAHGSDVRLAQKIPGGTALVRRLARRAELVYVAEGLRIDGAPGRVVPMPPARIPPRRTDEERERARAQLGLPPVGQGPLVLLFVGRMVPDKGADLLLDGLPPGTRLFLVGDGPERARLEQRAVGRPIVFAGARVGASLRPYLAAADLLVVPSRRDGAPTIIEEAAAVGLPVLCTAGVATATLGPGFHGQQGIAPTADALGAAVTRLVTNRAALTVGPVPPGWDEVGPRLWASPCPPRHKSTTAGDITVFYV